jgi:hypothetical protein
MTTTIWPKVHQADGRGKPVCGGGYKAKGVQWQTDPAEPNCTRCAAIVARRQAAGRTLLLAIAYLLAKSKFQL